MINRGTDQERVILVDIHIENTRCRLLSAGSGSHRGEDGIVLVVAVNVAEVSQEKGRRQLFEERLEGRFDQMRFLIFNYIFFIIIE